ncbi:Zinc finger protein 726, partial [Stegodyphus mimosarum]
MYHLNNHMLVQTEEKPCLKYVKCHLVKRVAKINIVLFTGEKPHIYEECNKLFSEEDNLNKHMHIHTGKKPCVKYIMINFK